MVNCKSPLHGVHKSRSFLLKPSGRAACQRKKLAKVLRNQESLHCNISHSADARNPTKRNNPQLSELLGLRVLVSCRRPAIKSLVSGVLEQHFNPHGPTTCKKSVTSAGSAAVNAKSWRAYGGLCSTSGWLFGGPCTSWKKPSCLYTYLPAALPQRWLGEVHLFRAQRIRKHSPRSAFADRSLQRQSCMVLYSCVHVSCQQWLSTHDTKG